MSWALVVLLLAGACSRLPSYARPAGELTDPGSLKDEDLVDYRELSRDDFRGDKPMGEAAEHLDAMGAQTYAIVRPDPNLKILFVETRLANGDTHYAGKLETRLHFRAQMDRRRSWWNPKLKEIPEAYVLQHEQIHFAIAALEAQKLNASSAELTAGMRAEGDSPDSVKDAIQAKLDDVIRAALGRLIERNGKFDEDTSARYAPKKQEAWWQRVSAELKP